MTFALADEIQRVWQPLVPISYPVTGCCVTITISNSLSQPGWQ